MGLWGKIKKVFGGVDDAVEDIAGNAWDYVDDQIDKAVAMLKQTHIGTSVLNFISIVDDDDIPGSEKFDKVVSMIMPVIKDFADNGRLDTTADQIEDFARQFVQSAYNDWNKAGGLKAIISPLIKLIKSIL